ncbi:response regulator transcription factor [Rhodococcus sp. ABRD24]|uniref:response regulator transcription factor n=1 Tax=Rhodococcus sp. ABRD24 TaxID=2507582 RepID=UPI00103C6CB5|nr:response regulator transcription factor [Rhodococcus sp. ABRD24]QBJ97501.1 response regulator transcription factor [Rhodococcus sp. ABRD24]
MPDQGLRIVLADDLPLLREGIAAVVESAGHHVCASVSTVDSLLGAVAAHNPDLVITDVRMPPTFTDEGLAAAVELRKKRPNLSVLILSQYTSVAYVSELIDNPALGGIGYLVKERVGHVREFVDVVEKVASGATVIDPEVVQALVGSSRRQGSLATLTARELEVLSLMAEGNTNARIAETLVVSDAAVRKHVGNIFAKLPLGSDTDRRVTAVLTYLRGIG